MKTDFKNLYDILQTPGVVNFVKFEHKEAPIPEYQIEALKRIIDSDYKYALSTERFKKGQQIIIKEGALNGLQGEIVSILNKKALLLRIDHVGYSLLVEIPAGFAKRQ